MLKFLVIAGLLAVLCRWGLGKWPWEFLTGPTTRSKALFRARTLLAVDERASRTEIIEAHKRLIGVIHPDRGGTNEQVHEANAARDLLLGELPDQGQRLP